MQTSQGTRTLRTCASRPRLWFFSAESTGLCKALAKGATVRRSWLNKRPQVSLQLDTALQPKLVKEQSKVQAQARCPQSGSIGVSNNVYMRTNIRPPPLTARRRSQTPQAPVVAVRLTRSWMNQNPEPMTTGKGFTESHIRVHSVAAHFQSTQQEVHSNMATMRF